MGWLTRSSMFSFCSHAEQLQHQRPFQPFLLWDGQRQPWPVVSRTPAGLRGRVRVTWVGAGAPSSHWFTLCLLLSASSFLPSLLPCFALNLKTVCVHVYVGCCHREPTLERRGVSVEHNEFHGSVSFLIGAIWDCLTSPCCQCPRSPSSVHFESVRWKLI